MLIWPTMHLRISVLTLRHYGSCYFALYWIHSLCVSGESSGINSTHPLHETITDPEGMLFPLRKPTTVFCQYWAVEIPDGEAVAVSVAEKYGFIFSGTILPGIYYFKQPRLSKRSIHHSIYFHDQLAYDPHVVWLQQQVLKVRVKRDTHVSFNDPHWPQMWYLNRGGSGGFDMNVRSAWARGFAGQGVVVTILDDGLEIDHPDLKGNYDPFASYDVNGNDENPEPRYPSDDKSTSSNRHGTRCAGEVAAVANNNLCGLGIAYLARIGGVRMLDGEVSDAMESRSLGHQMQHIDVYSASWGPEDDGKTVDGPGRLAQLAFSNGIQLGRGGLGSIFVWASGNGGKNGDNCNCDGYTNSIYTLGVSSVSEHGSVPWYAEMCSSTLAVTYSSGGHGERAVITTDLNHTCTSNHSGTSASAPLAAGICALTLSANSGLTWRDLQYLVVYTARPEGLFATDWRVNGVGRRVSHAFGYGLMDAGAMVELALNWTNVPPQLVCEAQAPIEGGPVSIRQRDQEVLALTTDGCASAAALAGDPSQRVVYLEHVQAKVTVSSAQRGEIELRLTSPSGTVSKLLSKRPKDIDVAGFHVWPFMSVHFWGETANGTWKLTVNSGNAAVSVHEWSLVLYGTNTPPPLHGSSHRRDVRQLPKTVLKSATHQSFPLEKTQVLRGNGHTSYQFPPNQAAYHAPIPGYPLEYPPLIDSMPKDKSLNPFFKFSPQLYPLWPNWQPDTPMLPPSFSSPLESVLIPPQMSSVVSPTSARLPDVNSDPAVVNYENEKNAETVLIDSTQYLDLKLPPLAQDQLDNSGTPQQAAGHTYHPTLFPVPHTRVDGAELSQSDKAISLFGSTLSPQCPVLCISIAILFVWVLP